MVSKEKYRNIMQDPWETAHLPGSLGTSGVPRLGSGDRHDTMGKHPLMRRTAVQPSSNSQSVTLDQD